jgi:hypothetical protein
MVDLQLDVDQGSLATAPRVLRAQLALLLRWEMSHTNPNSER